MVFSGESFPPEAAADLRVLRAFSQGSAEEIRSVAPTFSTAVAHWREILDIQKFIVLNGLSICETKEDFRTFCLSIGKLLGNLAVQNGDGATMIEVYDRRMGKIRDGVRYHQSRQGGDIHTDSVNHPQQFKYFLLGCVAPAILGGETIIVRAADVHSALAVFPEVLETLRTPFWFEGRGMDKEIPFFRAPVLSDKDGIPRFRYLRSYIESAHARVGQPLTSDEIGALDALDAALEGSALQVRFRLGRGDVLVCVDAEVLHGRTSFIDRTVEGAWADRRLMLRLWMNPPEEK